MRGTAFSVVILGLGASILSLAECSRETELAPGVAAQVGGLSITEEDIELAAIGHAALAKADGVQSAQDLTYAQRCIAAGRKRPSPAMPADRRADCERQWTVHRIAVLRFLIQGRWYALDAKRRDLDVPTSGLAARAASRRALIQPAAVEPVLRIRQTLLVLAGTQAANQRVFTRAEMRRQYARHRDRYVQREIRIVQAIVVRTRHHTRAVRFQLARGVPWGQMVEDSTGVGARQPFTGLLDTLAIEDHRVLRRAAELDRGETDALRVPGGWYLYRLVEINPFRRLSFVDSLSEIERDLSIRGQEEILKAFNAKLRTRFRDVTLCAKEYEQACK